MSDVKKIVETWYQGATSQDSEGGAYITPDELNGLKSDLSSAGMPVNCDRIIPDLMYRANGDLPADDQYFDSKLPQEAVTVFHPSLVEQVCEEVKKQSPYLSLTQEQIEKMSLEFDVQTSEPMWNSIYPKLKYSFRDQSSGIFIVLSGKVSDQRGLNLNVRELYISATQNGQYRRVKLEDVEFLKSILRDREMLEILIEPDTYPKDQGQVIVHLDNIVEQSSNDRAARSQWEQIVRFWQAPGKSSIHINPVMHAYEKELDQLRNGVGDEKEVLRLADQAGVPIVDATRDIKAIKEIKEELEGQKDRAHQIARDLIRYGRSIEKIQKAVAEIEEVLSKALPDGGITDLYKQTFLSFYTDLSNHLSSPYKQHIQIRRGEVGELKRIATKVDERLGANTYSNMASGLEGSLAREGMLID